MATIKPITPEEALISKAKSIDPEFIKTVNKLIIDKFDGEQAVISTLEFPDLVNSRFYIIDLYRKSGWVVGYDDNNFLIFRKPKSHIDYKRKKKENNEPEQAIL